MQPLKIGYDAKRYFLNQTGLGNYARTLIDGLSQHAHLLELHLYTAQSGNMLDTVPERVLVHQPHTLFGRIFQSNWRNQGIVKDLIANDISIFHGLSNELPLGIEKTAIKTVVTIHDLIFLKYPELYKPIDRMIYNQKVASAVKRANRIVACSKQTAKDLTHFYGVSSDKISVIYQDCNPVFKSMVSAELPALIANKYQLSDSYILAVGTLEKRKNQLNLLKAFEQAKLPNTQLVFVGKKADLYPQMAAFVQEKKLRDKVLFLDNVPLLELPALYQMASAFAYVSYEEGFGIPLLEAMWSGVPILTGNKSCLPEIAGDAALCIDPLSLTEMTEALTFMLSDESLRAMLVQNGFERALQFDSKRLAAQWQELYASLA